MAIAFPKSLKFDSRHPEALDAKEHSVTFKVSARSGLAGPAGTPYVDCTCSAGRFYWPNLRRGNRVTGCWAMQFARKAFGIPTPAFVVKHG